MRIPILLAAFAAIALPVAAQASPLAAFVAVGAGFDDDDRRWGRDRHDRRDCRQDRRGDRRDFRRDRRDD